MNQDRLQVERSTPVPAGSRISGARSAPIEFAGLEAGRYKIEFVGKESYVRDVSVNGQLVEDKILDLKEGEDLKNVRVSLSNDIGTVSGKITGYRSGGLVLVLLIRRGQDLLAEGFSGPPKSGVVDKDGNFSFIAPPGEYEAVAIVYDPEHIGELELINRINELRKNAPVINVSAREVVNLELPMPDEFR